MIVKKIRVNAQVDAYWNETNSLKYHKNQRYSYQISIFLKAYNKYVYTDA